MKRKLWVYHLEDMIDGEVDAYDYIYWGLAQQNVRDYVWLDENIEIHEVMTRYAMLLMGDAWEPIKKP